MKDESTYIEEWLCHHVAVGVQHFFLYDNGSADGIEGLLEGYLNRGLVTFVRFPMRGLQRDAYNHALRFFGPATEWLAYVDIDEFLVPAGRNPCQRSCAASRTRARSSSAARSSASPATGRVRRRS